MLKKIKVLESPEQLRQRFTEVSQSDLTQEQLLLTLLLPWEIQAMVTTTLKNAPFPPVRVKYDSTILSAPNLTKDEVLIYQSLHGKNRTDYSEIVYFLRHSSASDAEILHISSRLYFNQQFLQKYREKCESIREFNERLVLLLHETGAILRQEQQMRTGQFVLVRLQLQLKVQDIVQLLSQRNMLLQLPSFAELHQVNDLLYRYQVFNDGFDYTSSEELIVKSDKIGVALKFFYLRQLFKDSSVKISQLEAPSDKLHSPRFMKSIDRYKYVKPPPPTVEQTEQDNLIAQFLEEQHPKPRLFTKQDVEAYALLKSQFEAGYKAKFEVIKVIQSYLERVKGIEDFFQQFKQKLSSNNCLICLVNPYNNPKLFCTFEANVSYLIFEETRFKTEQRQISTKTNVQSFQETLIQPVKGLPIPGAHSGRKVLNPMNYQGRSQLNRNQSKSQIKVIQRESEAQKQQQKLVEAVDAAMNNQKLEEVQVIVQEEAVDQQPENLGPSHVLPGEQDNNKKQVQKTNEEVKEERKDQNDMQPQNPEVNKGEQINGNQPQTQTVAVDMNDEQQKTNEKPQKYENVDQNKNEAQKDQNEVNPEQPQQMLNHGAHDRNQPEQENAQLQNEQVAGVV